MPAYNVRIALEGHNSATNALIVNVLHAEMDTLTSGPNWTNVASEINDWLGTLWANLLSTGDTFDQIVVTDENYPGSTHGQGVFAHGTAGTRGLGDALLSPGICRVMSLKTAVAKRYARGHTFLPPAYTSAALSTPDSWNPGNTYSTAATAFANGYHAGHTAGSTGYVPIVFSRTRVAQGLTPFTFPVTVASLGSHQKFLRSRTTAP